jgi:hypothetical protein
MLLTITQARIIADAMALLGTIGGKLSTVIGAIEFRHHYSNGCITITDHHTGQTEGYPDQLSFMQGYGI